MKNLSEQEIRILSTGMRRLNESDKTFPTKAEYDKLLKVLQNAGFVIGDDYEDYDPDYLRENYVMDLYLFDSLGDLFNGTKTNFTAMKSIISALEKCMKYLIQHGYELKIEDVNPDSFVCSLEL